MTITGETARNSGLKCIGMHEQNFICILIRRFISLIFLSTSVALNMDVKLRRTDNLSVFLKTSVIRQLCSFFREKSINNVT